MKCTNCGAEVRDIAKFCSSCGATVTQEAAAPQRQFCVNCGAEVTAGDTFCAGCGARPDAVAPVSAASPAVGPSDAPGGGDGPALSSGAAAFQAAQRGAGPATATPRSGGARPQPGTSVQGVEYKGVIPRFLAALIDMVLYFIFTAVLASKFGTTSTMAGDGNIGFNYNMNGWPAFFASLVALAYLLLLEGYLGGTIGKLLLGIRIVNAAGRAPGLSAALVRNFMRIVDFLPFFYILGIVMVATSKQKQRFGDRVAGSYVVSRKGASAMRASDAPPKEVSRALTMVAAALTVLGLLSSAVMAVAGPQQPAIPGRTTSSPSSTAAQKAPTAVPTQVATSSSGSPIQISLPSIPGFGGGDPVDVAGKWSGTMIMSGAKLEGATAEEQKDIDSQLAAVKGKSLPMDFTFDGKSKDSGTVTLKGGMGTGGGAQTMQYKLSGDRVTIDGKVDEGSFHFEGKAAKKGSGQEIQGEFKAQGPDPDNKKTLTIQGSWSVTK
jgi:uncharacterized RDD family membrane protein YckC